MTKINWFSRLPNEHPSRTKTHRVAGGVGVAILLLMTGIAAAQGTTPVANVPDAPQAPQPVVQYGYVIHQTVDLGGHMAGISGSGAMYDTLVNIHSGPRVLGETFTMHAVPGSKHPLLDSLTAFSSGFGGDPYNFAKLDFSKGKLYEFSGLFRRDRQYSDYDLLANPSIPAGLSIPIGPSTAPTGSYAWPQVEQSPVMFNTVRRMTDTNLTIFPLSKVTFRVAYSQNIFQGPSLSPSRAVGKTEMLLQENLRNSTDDFVGAVDWKPFQQTKFTFEEQVTHYKEDSYYTLAPGSLNVQEADGTPVSLGAYDSTTPYGIADCNTGSMGSPYTSSTSYTILSPAQTPGGLPIINPACDVYSSYTRSLPTRILYPTEVFRFRSSSIRNIATNGDFRYTAANSNLPNYYENFQGLDGAVRYATFTGSASAKRKDVGADYGITWQATKTFSFADQIDYSNVQQPGNATISAGITANTPTNPNETINYAGPLVAGTNLSTSGITTNANGTGITAYGFFGQKFITNNATATWDVSDRATLSLTYRYRTHTIAEGIPHNAPIAGTATTNGTVTINENGGIFNAALRPTDHWNVNGTVEVLYDDNAFTPLGPRQTQHYRMHSIYRPRTWATISGAFNDLERHNNTNNTVNVTGINSAYDGPLDHVDHSRSASISADLSPNEHYGFNFTYAYSDVYSATNICFLSGATATLPGVDTGVACPDTSKDWLARDFMDAPTQYASVGLTLSPIHSIQSSIGYNISAVSGSEFLNVAQEVYGSLQSAYQSPYVHVAWTVHPGWIWRADYNYYGYGEGGPSGAPVCSSAPPVSGVGVTPVLPTSFPCSSSQYGPTGLTEPSSGLTAPRNFHANLLTLSMHYEF
jgi:hypothetical protein